MRDKVKRFISILMTALMLVNLMPVGALAEGVTISNSVQSRERKSSANVYVYVKVTGDKAGLTINPSGWYTIGKSTNVPGMGTPYWSMHGSHSFSDVGVWPDTVLDKSRFTRHADNQKIDLGQITWTEFYIDNGADNYVKAGTYTWHMNGTIDIKQLPSVYTIKYVDYDTKELIHSYEKTGLMGQNPEKITAPDSLQENLYSFYFVNGHPKEQTVDFKKDKGELTFYYKKNTAAYTVNYYLNGTTTKVADSITGTKALGHTMTAFPDDTITGYTPVSNESQSIKIKANSADNVIDFYYYKNVELTANSDTKTYNGSEQSVSGFTGAPDGADFSAITVGASGTDAGKYDVKFPEKTVGKVDRTKKYIVTKATDGQLEIKKREVTLTSASDEKVYDGTALTNGKVTVSGDGFANGEGATYKVTGTQTNVGSSDNTFTYELNSNTKAGNYTITESKGKLEVKPVADTVTVTIKGHKAEAKYDGQKHTAEGYDVSTSNALYTAADFKFTGTDSVTKTDAGTYAMGLDKSQFENKNGNFSNVTFVVEDGQLEIKKREVTLTSASDEKVYDGTALTNGKVTVSGDGFANGEGATYNVTGSQTDVGSSDNEFTYVLNSNTKADNYKITESKGKLEVTAVTDKVTVMITGDTASVTYDGKPHSVEGYTVTSISNPLYTTDDFTFNGDKKAEGTNAGEYKMGLTESQFTNTSNNFTNVTFVVTDGSLTINKREVTLTSASDSKEYDGTALTNGEVTVSGDGFANGEGATYNVTGSQTDVGSSDNEFTYTLNEGTNEKNYNIELAPGKLEVTPVTEEVIVTITGRTDEMPYDGKEHSVFGYDVTVSNALYNPKEDMQFNGIDADATAKGTDAGTYPIGLTAEHFTNKSDNFSKVTFVVTDGYVKITPRAVTLTSETAGKTYDGTALEKPVVTVGGDGFVEGQVKEIKATGSVTNAGSVANTITFTPDKETFKDGNYAITKNEGTLTIAKRSVLITSQSATKTYDGSALTRPAVTITGDGFVSGELAKAEATGSITNVGSTPNAIQYTTTGAFNAANYSIALSVGTLTVTEKPQPEPRRTFNLTVNYVYQNGKRAAASYNRGGLKNGETFDITSPVIAGYTASETVVSGTIYNRDIKVTVIYTADGVNLDDYGVPLGLGNITMNVGDCFE